jgi:hypothetical protein
LSDKLNIDVVLIHAPKPLASEEMKQYYLYLFIGFTVLFSVILNLHTQPPGILLTFTVTGSVGLLVVASIASLFIKKVGAGVASLCSFLMVPWLYVMPVNVMSGMETFHAAIIVAWVPFFLVAISLYNSIKNVLLNDDLGWSPDQDIKPLQKYITLTIHVLLTIICAFLIFTA